MTTRNPRIHPKDPVMVRNARLESRGHRLILEILIFLLIYLIATCVQGVISLVPSIFAVSQTEAYQEMLAAAQTGRFDYADYLDTMTRILEQLPSWFQCISLFATVGTIVTVLFYCRKIEKRNFSTLGLTKKHFVSEYLLGLLLGLVLFTLAYGLMLLTGSVSFAGVSFQPAMLGMLIATFLGYMIQGAAEELLCRGYFCISVSRWMPLWVGLLVNSLAFSLLHAGNPGVSPLAFGNLFLFGVFMTLYMIRRGNLWGCCAIHTMWNFAQGNLFGLQVSGLSEGDSALLAVQDSTKALWNGGDFGPEGGLCVTIVLAVGILLLLVFGQNRNLGQTPEPVGEANVQVI